LRGKNNFYNLVGKKIRFEGKKVQIIDVIKYDQKDNLKSLVLDLPGSPEVLIKKRRRRRY